MNDFIRVTARSVLMLGLILSFPSWAEDSLTTQKALYEKHCQKCHSEDGSGKKPSGEWMGVAKTLKLEKPEVLSIISAEAKKLTDDDILKSIVEGKGKMKPLKDKMPPEEAKTMVTYTRHLQGQAK